MEQETILYYYLMPEQPDNKKNKYTAAAKRHLYQKASLTTVMLTRQTEFNVLGCPIPPFYYRRRPWKAEELSRLMETVLSDAAGMTDTCVHPELEALLSERYRSRWMPREDTTRMLVKRLLQENAERILKQCGTVTVLLGQPADTDRQMEMTWELLQPYLPKVNRMLIYYERQRVQQDGQEDFEEVPEAEEPAMLREYLETYYYEYGLVPRLEPYIEAHTVASQMPWNRQDPESEPYRKSLGESAGKSHGELYMKLHGELYRKPHGVLSGKNSVNGEEAGALSRSADVRLHCGREKCGGIILDYCGQFRYPKIVSEGGVYIDITSVWEKEQMIRRKGLPVPYLSPLKYLDTMVKNSYDR